VLAAETGQVKSAQNHMSGNATNQMELVIVPNLNQAALIARTSEARSSTGIMGSSPLVLTGRALM
jgi:hypothetical protein